MQRSCPALPNEPFSRFTPKAVQSRLDKICGGGSLALMLRVVFLSFSAASTDLPSAIPRFGRVIGFN